MKYLLDTNVCIYIIKKKPASVIEKFKQLPPMAVGVSTITIAELEFGVEKNSKPEENREALNHFLLPLIIAPFEKEDTPVYGEIRHSLESRGTPIGAMDLLIAAQAKRRDVILVTNNTAEFSRVSGLRLENWAANDY